MDKITKSLMEIYNDAPGVAVDYYLRIEGLLDSSKGKGFAEKHQDLVVGLVKVAQEYYRGEVMAAISQDSKDSFFMTENVPEL